MNWVKRAPVVLAAVAAVVGSAIALLPAEAVAATAPRVDLRVLVVTDGTPWVEGIKLSLADEGVPYTTVDLQNAARPAITTAFLSDTVSGTPRAKFQGVVLPGDAPAGLTAAEQAALATFESAFSVRQINSFVYPSVNTGMNPPTFTGAIDGTTATATPAALGNGFANLRGPVKFDDNDPAVPESYAYLASPLPDDAAAKKSFSTFLTAPQPGTANTGVLAGVYRTGSREQLSLNFAFNYYQLQHRYLSHGLITWLTKGVHLGYSRNYLTVHADDTFSQDSRWSVGGNCTPGEGDCPAGVPETTPIRMTPADVTATVAWQQANGFTLDMLFNGAGSDQYVAANGSDPLLTAFQQNKNAFRWMNHTYTHLFLGCEQDFSVIPWRCATGANGATTYVSKATIASEITKNLTFATQKGFPVRRGELVAGEHSGTFILPQQQADNPNFVAQLTSSGITSLGLDASREANQRKVGSALSIPRHPLTVYFNTGTRAEMVDEYNWIYTSRANGGSGVCEDNPATTTCIAPLSGPQAFDENIVPKATAVAMSFVTANDPRPSYAHVSNLAEDRLLLPMVKSILDTYKATYATNSPIVSQTQTDAGVELQNETAWRRIANGTTVSAWVQGGTVTVNGPFGTKVPVTAPNGTRIGLSTFGAAYAGERSAYQNLGLFGTTLSLAATPYVAGVATPAAPAAAAPVPPATVAPMIEQAGVEAAAARTPVEAPTGGG